MRGKQGKAAVGMGGIVIWTLVIVIVAFGGFWFISNQSGLTIGGVDTPSGVVTEDGTVLQCQSDTGLSAMKANVFNGLNTTSSENFDVTLYLTDNTGQIITSVADTTSPDAVNVACGVYDLAIVRVDGAAGDSSQIRGASINAPNTIELTETGARVTIVAATSEIRLTGEQHGTLEFRGRDNNQAGDFLCNNDDSCSDFETDGVTFVSTTNGTVMDEALGLDLVFDVRAVEPITDFTDQYMLIALELPTASWDTPSMKVDGASLTDIKASGLTTFESRLLSDYEYVYKSTSDVLDEPNGITVDYDASLISGVTSVTADPQIDFLSAGNYLSTDGLSIKTGAATDASTTAAVYTVQDVTLDVTA